MRVRLECFPANFSSGGVERDDVAIGRRVVNHVLIDREGFRPLGRTDLRILVRPLVLPDDVSVGSVDRHYVRSGRDRINNAVVNQRNRFSGAGGQALYPGDMKLADVFLVDLLERAVAPRVVGSAELQPVVRTRIQKHVRRDRFVVLHRAMRKGPDREHSRRWRGWARDWRAASRRRSTPRRLCRSLGRGRSRCLILRARYRRDRRREQHQ